MRLINADKLIDNLDEMILADDGGDYAMGIATAIQEVGRMAFYEEVKAIPISMLRRWLNKQDMPYKDYVIDVVEHAINAWEKENERV